MKLARFRADSALHLGVVDGTKIVSLTRRIASVSDDMIGLIAIWDDVIGAAEAERGHCDFYLADVELLAPVARPGKILGIGLNYADHVAEAGIDKPEHQVWFSKAVTCVNAPYGVIQRPLASGALDYEAELVFIVGRRGRHISAKDAHSVIFGYCIGNDVSVRDWQLRTGQYMIGKSFDTHAPFGPFIVTPDEIDPLTLGIRSFVNDEKRQDSNTSHLIFDPAAQIEHLSQAMTLEPGDVIYTGTPGGVGAAMKPPQFLKAGDRVRVEIDGLGFIENEVIDERVLEDIRT